MIMALLVAALAAERTEAVILQALNSVSTADVQAWFAANGEPSLLAKRRQALRRFRSSLCSTQFT
jgi:hypothetical protein